MLTATRARNVITSAPTKLKLIIFRSMFPPATFQAGGCLLPTHLSEARRSLSLQWQSLGPAGSGMPHKAEPRLFSLSDIYCQNYQCCDDSTVRSNVSRRLTGHS